MKELQVRKPNRLKGYDYSQRGLYFITICTKNRHEMFGEIIAGQSILGEYGLAVKQEIEKISKIRRECVIEKYVIMPNHLHMIVRIVSVGDDGNRPVEHLVDNANQRADCHPPLQRQQKSISNMVQGLKGAITRQIGFSLWQRSFHDHIIRTEQDYICISDYIDNNPSNWNTDCFYTK